MAQQIIDVGSAPNDGLGDPIRTSFIKSNDNFTELYARAQTSPPPTLVGLAGDEAGFYAYDSSYFYYCFANYDGSSVIWAQVTQVGNVSLTTISSGTSNVRLTDVNGNAAVSVGGVSNVAVFTTTGQLVTGSISASGNITGNYFLGNGSLLTGLPETYSNANVASYLLTNTGNIAAGNVSATGNITGGNILSAGLISTSGNIASQGRISATGNIETAGYFVGTFVGNVTGNFVVPGSNTEVIFNTNGNADAVGAFTFDTNGPNLLTVLGTISSQGNVIAGNITTSNVVTATGNITGGNVLTAGLITATGNVTGGNLRTAGLISATGTMTSAANITGANFVTVGVVTATGNVSGGNLRATNDLDLGGNATANGFTGVFVSVTGNITGGNLRTAGIVSATGNITGGNVSAGQLSGTTLSASGNVTGGNILTAGVVSVTGNVTANYFIGNGSALTGLPALYGNAEVATFLAAFGSNTISTTGNITSGNYATGGLITVTGNITGGNVSTAGLVTATGNVTGGNFITAGTLNVNSGNSATAIYNGGGNTVGNIGSSSRYFDTVFAQATSALYADLAECYSADNTYEPGTVVMFGGPAEITCCDSDMCVTVAGVISTRPAYRMNAGMSSDHVADVALTGRVPCKVQGPVTKGAMMVSAGDGRARAESNPAIGSVLGKAVESFNGEFGIIEIAVGRL